MEKTIVIQIGNSDDGLSQRDWSLFVQELHAEFRSPAIDFHFFGFSPGAALWQNACLVFNVDAQALGYADFKAYLNDLRYILSGLANKWDQDSIALLVGETEFITSNYITQEIFSADSNEEDSTGQEGREEGDHHGEEDGQEDDGEEVDDFDGYGSKEDQLAAQGLREEDRNTDIAGVQGGRSLYP